LAQPLPLSVGFLPLLDSPYASTGGRIIFALLGIGVSLVGVIYILPAAFNKNAFWKGNSAATERASIAAAAKTTMEHSR